MSEYKSVWEFAAAKIAEGDGTPRSIIIQQACESYAVALRVECDRLQGELDKARHGIAERDSKIMAVSAGEARFAELLREREKELKSLQKLQEDTAALASQRQLDLSSAQSNLARLREEATRFADVCDKLLVAIVEFGQATTPQIEAAREAIREWKSKHP